jgi:uncharacterized protein
MENDETPVNDLNTVVPIMVLSLLDWAALVILIIGGLNWGLLGIARLDIVAAILGPGTAWTRAVYGLVGLAALYGIVLVWRLMGHGADRAPH